MSQKTRNNFLFLLLLLSVILISATTTYAFIKNTEKEEKIEGPKREYHTYKTVDVANTVDVYKEYPINPISVSFEDDKVSIDGLKDVAIENKINEKLSELEETENEYGTDNCRINFNVSNVLSVTCGKSHKNIDLTTGQDITIEDLFQKDSDIHSIIMDTLYKGYCSNLNCHPDTNVDEDYQNNVENFVAASYKKILNDEHQMEISYGNMRLHIGMDGYYMYIDYYNYKDEITIYDRFLKDETIYESDIVEYCNPYNCYNKTYNEIYEDSYNYKDFLNESVYLNFNISNRTHTLFGENTKMTNVSFDMNSVGKKVLDEIIKKENLDRPSEEKLVINISTAINNIGNENLISYIIRKYEMTAEEYEDYLLGNFTYDYETTNSVDLSMIVDKEGNISSIETDPNKVFKNFHSRIVTYIEEEIEKDDTTSPFYNLKAFDYTDSKSKANINRIVNLASYAVDTENQKLYMYYEEIELDEYMGGFMLYIEEAIPFDVFSLKSAT